MEQMYLLLNYLFSIAFRKHMIYVSTSKSLVNIVKFKKVKENNLAGCG